MEDYSYAELMKMQNDAVKRVEEMQSRARLAAGLESENAAKGTSASKNAAGADMPRRVPMPDTYLDGLKNFAANSSFNGKTERAHESFAAPENEKPVLKGIDSLFGEMSIDNDTLLILSLVLLLSEEKADELLILALLYILT